MEETPEKICGGKVLEIGGRDHEFVRGAGVDRILHTVRMAVITQAGASGMLVDLIRSMGRDVEDFFANFEGLARLFAVLILLFSGVDFEGECWSPRGVGATIFVGLFLAGVPFVGVVCVEPARDGVPGAEPLTERLRPAELAVRDRSRYV
jgi:hypothetical protein